MRLPPTSRGRDPCLLSADTDGGPLSGGAGTGRTLESSLNNHPSGKTHRREKPGTKETQGTPVPVTCDWIPRGRQGHTGRLRPVVGHYTSLHLAPTPRPSAHPLSPPLGTIGDLPGPSKGPSLLRPDSRHPETLSAHPHPLGVRSVLLPTPVPGSPGPTHPSPQT